ncbi:putative quinol monooxygenase [Taklimakanibacter deserti]|uniref:putative quinol monooxygenase n=1 Tax=Taklimakanibacter deserti TaxID=2267839 RepID=UPI000E65120F
MTGYVILVDFLLKPGSKAEFRRAIDVNARASCATERGCSRFDVVEPQGEPDRILLYEIYDDRAAFEEHLKTPHLAAFEAASNHLVTKKTVIAGDLVCEGSRE